VIFVATALSTGAGALVRVALAGGQEAVPAGPATSTLTGHRQAEETAPGSAAASTAQPRKENSSRQSRKLPDSWPEKRRRRQSRWVLKFTTDNGPDYARQLQGLGAVLAIPKGDNQYLVIRDLQQRPVQPKPEDIKKINRILWVEDEPQVVQSLAQALGIKPVPPYVVALFPPCLEDELREKESRAYSGNEDDIEAIYFRVEQRYGRYEPILTRIKFRAGAVASTPRAHPEKAMPGQEDRAKSRPAAPRDRLEQLLGDLLQAGKSDETIIEALYLATLSRLPTDLEKRLATAPLAGSKDRREALTQLLEVLISSQEFLTDLDARKQRDPRRPHP
jgi:hypothetical protein